MISVIISSGDARQLSEVTQNITSTIGVPFELIGVDNSGGKRGICEVYNAGIKQAKYDILCFMHDDIVIKTNNWGAILMQIFEQEPGLGLVGVVGGSYQPLAPSGRGATGIDNVYANIIQFHKHSDKEEYLYYWNPREAGLEYVAAIDGVWMASTKKVASSIKFDEHTFKGFHGYDVDFSLAVGQQYKVAVTYQILLAHLSEGRYNKAWMDDNLKLHKKWREHLPVNTGHFGLKERIKAERSTFKEFIRQLAMLKYPASVALHVLRQNKKKYMAMDKLLYWKLRYHILKIYLKGA